MNRMLFRTVPWVLLAAVLTACANPFADAASTKGPSLNVTAGVGKITVSWNNVLGASGYHLEWATTADFTNATVVEPASSPVAIDNATPGNAYFIRAQANLKSGPSSWSTATVQVTGWTWAPAAVDLGTQTISNPKTIVVAGTTIDVSTSYTVNTVRYETLKYTSSGLARSTFLRATTKFTGVTGTKVDDTTPVVVTGNWDPGLVWTSLKLGGSSYSITNPSADRTSFTFDGATWTLTP